jgi:hypothetical protein
MDIERANDLLRYGIGVLQGKYIVATQKGRLHIALILKKRLASAGFWWQVKVLDAWIHRAQGGEFNV